MKNKNVSIIKGIYKIDKLMGVGGYGSFDLETLDSGNNQLYVTDSQNEVVVSLPDWLSDAIKKTIQNHLDTAYN